MPFIDFAALKERLPIDSVASILDLKWKQEGGQLRTTCPHHGGERGLVVTPEKGMFICMATSKGGDCIGLYAHIHQLSNYQAAQALLEEFGTVNCTTVTSSTVSKSRAKHAEEATAPQKPERRTGQNPQPAPFDPNKFAAKLEYSDEVAALGISEDDASRLTIGWHPQRKCVYFAVRNPDGSLSGFIGAKNGELRLPPQWIASNVKPFIRRA